MNRHIWFRKMILLLPALGLLLLPFNTFAEGSIKNSQQKRASQSKYKFTLHDFTFNSEIPLATLIRSIADLEQINVIFEDSIAKLVETKRTTFAAKSISAPSALEAIFNANRLSYAPVDKRTIIVFQEALANRQRYDEQMVRVFYIKYANIDEVRNSIQLGVGSKQIVPLKQLNALLVRDTEENFKMIEALLTRIDKPQTEFVMDVNLYEVSDQTALQISNQSGTLSASDQALLQNRTSSKLIGSTKLHAFENEPAILNMGKRVAVPTKTKRVSPDTDQSKQPENQSGQSSDNVANRPSSFEEEQFQYVDVGLNMEMSPRISEENILIKMNIDMTGVTKTTPNVEFNQHRVKEYISLKKGETKIVANTFPLVGNFFASSSQKGNINIILTITPHIIRSAEIIQPDRSSFGPNGTPDRIDASITLEEMLLRAKQDEEQSK